MDTMNCTLARNLLSEYQDGALDDGAAAALAAHLRGCGECAGCADSLLAVREALRTLPPDPAPPELLARTLAAVEAEDRDAHANSAAGGTDATRPFLSRFRIPLEAAAAVLLFASVYWYQRTSTPPVRPPSAPIAQAPTAQAPESTPRIDVSPEASRSAANVPPPAIRLPRGKTKTAKKEEAPAVAKPRTWNAADLPSAPVTLASTNSERIVPVAQFNGPTTDPAAAGTSAGGRGRADTEGGADFRLSRFFAAPPSRLLRPLPYGRDIVVDVEPGSREGAEERIAEAAMRLGGIFERIDRGAGEAAPSASGIVRVILPEFAATRFLEEMGRIGKIPPEGAPAATDLPAGPRPGTVAYAVHIRVR
ncbi:zf-HC2 domain-containing protein [Candidatus Deferrimicrobium sp.]|uniref:zf-HC2 domain-containing protein n=1 Tax=Candidatus Deferrimicrobium sp. TaxID=3060586 RepID=UPI002ED5B0E0